MRTLRTFCVMALAALTIAAPIFVRATSAQTIRLPTKPAEARNPNDSVRAQPFPPEGRRRGAIQVAPTMSAVPGPQSSAVAGACAYSASLPTQIVALASALKCEPGLIFEYIHNNIEFEPIFGSNKGALGALLDRRGSDVDQASLFQALLDASGYTQTEYLWQWVSFTGVQIAGWLAVKNDAAAIQDLLYLGGFPVRNYAANPDGTLAYIEVQLAFLVLIVDGEGYPLNPSYKQHTMLSGIPNLAAALGYSRAQFLGDAGGSIDNVSISNVNRSHLRGDLTGYADTLLHYINQNDRTWSVGDLIGGKLIEPLTTPSLILKSIPKKTRTYTDLLVAPSLPAGCTLSLGASCRTIIEITMPNASPDKSIKLFTDEVYGHRITVFSAPNGGNYVPTLLIDGVPPTCVATGACTNIGPSTPYGQIWSICVAVTQPNQPPSSPGSCPAPASCPGSATACQALNVNSGGAFLISLGVGQVQRGMPEYHRQLLAQARAAGNSDNSELVLGESLAVIGYNWLAQVSSEQQMTDQLTKTTALYNFVVGIAGQTNLPQGTFQWPFVDLPLIRAGFVPQSSNGPTVSVGAYTFPAAIISAFGTYSLTSSAFESAVLEQTQASISGMTAASTIKIVDANMNASYSGANQKTFFADGTTCAGQATFTRDIAPAIQPPNYSSTVFNAIVAAVTAGQCSTGGAAAGQLALLPGIGHLAVGQWKGAGYTEIFPQANGAISYAQLISGGWSGGSSGIPVSNQALASNNQRTLVPAASTGTVSELQNTTPSPSNPSVAEPIDGVTGAYVYQNLDLVTGSGGFPYALPFSRTYLSSSGSNLTTTTADRGLGNGWAHAYSVSAQTQSDPYSAMGSSDAPAVSSVTSIAALYVMQDLLSIAPTAQTMTISSMVARWFTDQLTSNVVMVSQPNTTEEFIAQPHADGATSFVFTPPPGSSVRFMQTAAGQFTYTRKDGVTQTFGPLAGQPASALLSWTYPFGASISLTYTGSQLAQVANNFGRRLTFSYSGADISGVTDDTGRSVAYSYDGNHNLIGFVDPLGSRTTYSYGGVYDALGHLTQIYYPFEPGTPFLTNWYDQLGRVVQQANANGNSSRFYFAGSRTEVDDPIGNRQVTYQTDRGKILSDAVVLDNSAIGNVYNDTPQQNGVVNVTHFQYDGIDRLTTIILPEGGTKALTYATAVNPWANNIASIIDTPKPGSPLPPRTASFTYDPFFNKTTSITDPMGLVTTMAYDSATGNLLSIVADNGSALHFNATSSFRYDAYGHVISAKDPVGIATTFAYDASSNLVTRVAGAGSVNAITRFGYDAVGNVVSRTDPNGNTTTLAYDANRRLLTATAPSPFNSGPMLIQTSNVYDPDGHLLSVTRSNAATPVVTQFTYTPTGKPRTFVDPNGNTTTYNYDAVDRVASVVDPLLVTTNYSYDAASRLIAVATPAIQSVPLAHFAYTPDGRVGILSFARSNAQFNITTLAYDGFDRLATTTYPNSSVERLGYDANDNILTRQTRAGPTIAYTYDTLNRLSTKAAPSEATVTYRYDLDNRLTGASDNSAAIPSPTIAPGPTLMTATMSYDVLNRMTALNFGTVPNQTAPPASTTQFGFAYDRNNRRTGQTASDNSWWFYPAASPGTVNYSVNNLDQYTAVGAITPTYDGNGSLTFDGVFTYGYDAESRLISASQGGDTVATYAYDARGHRKSKTVGGSTTLYVTDPANRALFDYATSGEISRWYAFGPGLNEPLAQINVAANTRTTFIPDIQGSIIGSLDSATGVVAKTGYGPFGESATTSGTFRYTGARIDAETNGLYDFRARMYSPTLGRFLRTDPISYAGGSNLYAYVGNDPLNLTDPLGLAADGPQAVAASGSGRGGGCDEADANCFEAGAADPASIAGQLVPSGTVESSKVLFGQRRAGPTFGVKNRPVYLAGRSIADVADDLRTGVLHPDQLPIDAFRYGEYLVSANTRSLAALSEAGLSPTVVNEIGPSARLLRRLLEVPIISNAPLPGPRVPVTPSQSDFSVLRIIELAR
ncbi:MAG: RHS repeat-associated core domain-containing protein [Beijerinckiaceae bacterium]